MTTTPDSRSLRRTEPAFRAAVEKLRAIHTSCARDPELRDLIDARDDVLARYGALFTPEGIAALGREEFLGFLRFRNNRHWTGLQRMGPAITADMAILRQVLAGLLDEEQPVGKRLDAAIEERDHGDGMVRVQRLGKAVLTPILLIAHPERYGVWNGTSEGAMRELGVWPDFDRGESVGRRFERINAILLTVAEAVGVDLWALDALWWRALRPDDGGAESSIDDEENVPVDGDRGGPVRFGLERHLQDFLLDNWERTSLGQEWDLVVDGGDVKGYGYERPTPVGRIDLLAKHKQEPRWLVIELKRDQSSDQTLGQVQRYMGWVQQELAREGESVEGLIVARSLDEHLRFALKVARGVAFRRYVVDFSLEDTVGGWPDDR